jgi:hypothetical protein
MMQFIGKSLLGVVGLCSLQAQADSSHQFDYLGLNIQKSSYQDLQFSPQLNPVALAPLAYNESLSGIGFRGFIGHQFNNFFALEAGIGSYGKADFRVTQETIGSDGSPSYKTLLSGGFETATGDMRVVGTYPISDKVYLKANLGALIWSNESTILTGSAAVPETDKISDNGISAIAGFGIGYGFNNKVALTLDFEKTKIAGINTQNLGLALIVRI